MYKASILFFSLLLLPPFFANAQQQSNPTLPSITMNPIFNIKVKANSTATNDVSSTQIMNEGGTKETYTHIAHSIKNLFWQQRYPLIGGALLVAYGSINLILALDYAYCTSPTRWVAWKSDCSYADLWAMPKKDVEKELLRTIAQRHYNIKNPTDKAHPLIRFIREIDTETYRLRRYIKLSSVIKKAHLMKLFSVSNVKLEKAKQLLERARFIKQVFLSWLADYNMR